LKKINSILACVSLVIVASPLYPQSFEHRKFKYDWNDAIRITLTQSPVFKEYDAVILYEETTLDVVYRNIKRYQVFQFNNQDAIDKHNLFRVPIVMDAPLWAVENIYRVDSASFPMLTYEKINFFDARIIRNGEFVKAVLDEVAFKNEERTGEYLIPYYVHYFYVRNLEPGDQLEVIISHEWPLFTSKYYINEIVPKQEVTVVVNNSSLGQVDTYVNEQLALFRSNVTSKDNSAYRINFENVQPVNPKLSSRIYDLPRIEFFENKVYLTNEKVFGSETIDTLNWRKLLYRFVTRIDANELRTWENYDLQSYKTSLYFDKLKKGAGNLSGVYLMDYIHQYTVDKLEFKNDFNYFIHEEHGFHDMGTHLENNIYREASRHEYYFNMLDRVNQPYYKVLLQDRRIQVLDTNLVGVIYMDGLSYMVYDNDSVPHLYHPKRSRSGYYTNELPFYYTDQYTFLVPQTVPRKIYDKDPESIRYPIVYIPEPAYAFNSKKTVSHVDISLDHKTSKIDTRLNLSGQYSTLTRGYYLYGDKDTTISPTYYTDIFKKCTDATCKLDSSQKTFPYYHQFSLQADPFKNVLSTIEGDFVIDLASLINIHYEIFDSKHAKASFRHDFTGKEEFIIQLDFDKLVTIENAESYNKEISTKGFYFASNLVKIADNEYGLKIIWEVKENLTLQKDLPTLEEAFRTIKKFTQLKLKVKLQ
jgi:hypothetical protein